MAETLRSDFKWKSNYNHRYLRLDDGKVKIQDGILEFTGEDSSRIFKTKTSLNNSEYVSIKHSKTKLYLARGPAQTGNSFMIVATADSPNENVIDENCTLFELFKADNDGPTDAKEGFFRIRHVQSNLYLRPQKVSFDCAMCKATSTSEAVLCAVSPNHDRGDVDLFTITSG